MYIIWSLAKGGAERVVANLAKGLDRQIFNPIIFCLNKPGDYAAELEKESIKVIALDKRPKLDLQIIGKLVKVMKDNKIDIVHAHLWTSNFWGRVAAKIANVPIIICTEHNVDSWKSLFHHAIDSFLSRFTDKIIAVSNKVKEFYVGKGIPSKKIEVIYNGVQTNGSQGHKDTRSHVKQEFGIKDEEKVLAVIGRLVEQKGHKYLLEALSQLNGKYDFKLLVVGNGPLTESLKSQVTSLKLDDKVIFTGFRRDINRLFEAIDVLVMPSLREGLPLIALEAMISGVPIVATKVGGTPEVVEDGISGVLVSQKNPAELANGLRKILDDKELAEKYVENGKNRVKDLFSIDIMIKKHEILYEELLSKK